MKRRKSRRVSVKAHHLKYPHCEKKVVLLVVEESAPIRGLK